MTPPPDAGVDLGRRRAIRTLALGLPSVALLGCSSSDVEVHVLAAASLREVVDEAIAATGATDVRLESGPSSALAVQVVEGRSVDLVVLADEVSMTTAQASGRLAPAVVVATNEPVLAVPAASTKVRGAADLAGDDVVVSLCDPAVPCGRAADALLVGLGLRGVAERAVRDQDVRAVVGRLRSGEVDAGVVYATDARRFREELVVVELPEGAPVPATAVVAALAQGARRGAVDVLDRLRTEAGRARLVSAGFGLP